MAAGRRRLPNLGAVRHGWEGEAASEKGGRLAVAFRVLAETARGRHAAPPPPSQEWHFHDGVTKSAAAASALRQQLAHEGDQGRLLLRRQLHAQHEVEKLHRILQRQEAPVVTARVEVRSELERPAHLAQEELAESDEVLAGTER